VCVLDSSGSGQIPVASSCECGNKSSGSVKDGEYLCSLTDYQLLK
jgi:hypothetical protein